MVNDFTALYDPSSHVWSSLVSDGSRKRDVSVCGCHAPSQASSDRWARVRRRRGDATLMSGAVRVLLRSLAEQSGEEMATRSGSESRSSRSQQQRWNGRRVSLAMRRATSGVVYLRHIVLTLWA